MLARLNAALTRMAPSWTAPSWVAMRTLVIAALGVVVFELLSLPLPFLLGPMFACLAAALAGMDLTGSSKISTVMRTVIGVAAGSAITPQIVGMLDDYATSLALTPLLVASAAIVGVPFFHRVCGFDRPTAFYSAMPGGLQDMIIFGQEAGGDPRALSLAHATRVLLIVASAPLLVEILFATPLDAPPGAPASALPIHEMILMAFAAIAGWRAAAAVGLFGASVLGPLILAAILSLSDIIHGRPPAEAVLAAQFFIGIGVGVKYVGVTAQELRRIVAASAGYCVWLALLTVIFATIAARIGAASPVEALLAFAPGGQGEMIILGIMAGVDVAYVATIHITRVFIVILSAPIAARLWR